MLLARTHAAAHSNAPSGLFGADVLGGDRGGIAARGVMPRTPVPHPAPSQRPEPAARRSPGERGKRPAPAAPVKQVASPANAGGAAARVWAAYVVGRALSA